MPPYPGEDRLVTVFADIHYYFAQPTVRPLLHRFDKASYFYIYYNATRHTSRIEVANNPGTQDQDAFNGYIDSCRVTNSAQFSTLLTIVVDGVTPQSPTSPKTGRDPEEWHLSSGDPRDANRTKYKLHTLDVYLWAPDDARLVIECFRKLLPASQLDLADPEPEHGHYQEQPKSTGQAATAMSPVVQNLENLAVHDPVYNGQQGNRSAVSPTSSFASHNILPPPPPAGGLGQQIHSPSPAISDMSSQPARQTSVRSNQSKPQSQNFAPMAYNPAAPAAPEPIKHREKTPPPEDGVSGTGLNAAARHDQGYVPGPPQGGAFQVGYQPGQGPPQTFGGGGYASPPPQQPGHISPPPTQQMHQGYASPLPQHLQQGHSSTSSQQHQGYHSPPPGAPGSFNAPTQATATTFNSPPPSSGYSYGTTQPDNRSSMTSTAPSFGPGASSTMSQGQGQRHSTAAEQYVPMHANEPVPTPGTEFYNSLGQGSNKPLSHVRPQYADYLSAGGSTQPQQEQGSATRPPPMGGYSQYDYRQGGQQQQQQQQGSQYDVHQQVYRPTEAEANSHHKKPSRQSTSKNERPSTVDKVEKRAMGLFKKLEKRIG